MVVIEVLRPTSRTLCEAYFAKNPSRIKYGYVLQEFLYLT
jgi:hypothetical protein